MIAVRVLKDGAVVRETVITALPATLGRDASCEVVLFDGSVSRRHAVLQLEESGVVLRDLGSRNGLVVEGALRTAAPLATVLHCRLGALAIEIERLSAADTGAFSLAALQRAERRRSVARPILSLAIGLSGFLLGTVAEPSFWSPYQKNRGLLLSGQALGFVLMLLLGAFGLLIVLKAAGRAARLGDTLAAGARVVWLWPATVLLQAASYYVLGTGTHAVVRDAVLPNLATALGVATLAAAHRPGRSRRFRLAWAVAILAVATALQVNQGLAARRAGTPALDHAVMPPVGSWTGPTVSEDAFLSAFERESAVAAKDAAEVSARQDAKDEAAP